MTAGMGVRKNVHIEDWVAKRENLEMYFKFTKGAWARFAVFGIAVPYAAYQAIVYEMETPGQAVGRGAERFNMPRKYWGGSGGTRAVPSPPAASAPTESED